VHGRLRASLAVRRETPSRAGRVFSQRVIASLLMEASGVVFHAGRRNRRIWYSRLSWVQIPTSWTSSQRSIHSPTVIFPAAGSVQRPSRMRASWSRPKLSAEVFVSKLYRVGLRRRDAAGC
jgi:hypothetical protein